MPKTRSTKSSKGSWTTEALKAAIDAVVKDGKGKRESARAFGK